MNRLISVLASGALAATAIPAAAQDDAAQVVPDLATLEALCETNASSGSGRGLCLYVVHEIMLPGTGRDSEGFGLGDARDRDGMSIKPLKVNWNVKPTNTYSMPGKGMRFVGVLVEYRAGEDAASYNETSWEASDRKGITYDQPTIGAEPDLDSGQIRPGETVRGWVTFEIPRNARWLEIRQVRQFRDTLHWTVRDEKRK